MKKRVVQILAAMAIFARGVTVGHNTNVYWGLNKGVTWGTVGGCEVVGEIGCWLGDRDEDPSAAWQ